MSPRELPEDQLGLCELIEKKLAIFVKKSKNGGETRLYDLVMPMFEKPLLELALKESGWNKIQAAQLLGIHRNTLRKKMKELQIENDENE
jgi:two-component system nitrogen regulation response regulator GlnG